MKPAIGGAVLAVLGVACIKIYGDYKYYCGKVDAGDFYRPIIETMGDQIKDLCNRLKSEEKGA